MPNFKSNSGRSVPPGKNGGNGGNGGNGAPQNPALHTQHSPTLAASAGSRSKQSRPGSSFAARFGRIILQDGIAAIPSAMFHYQGEMELSAQQVWFVSYILSHKWDEDLPYPSLKAMARRVGMSLSQLQRIKNTLCQAGYLEVYPRFTEKQGQATNAYDFSGLFDKLEELIMADAPTPNVIRAEDENPPDMAELGEVDPSFVARYGRVITRRGVAAVPRAIFTHQAALKLTPQQVWFITYIFSFQWATALPYPSIRRMATLTGYSSVQLHTIKAELVMSSYLRLVHRSNEQGGQDTNAYDFSGLLEAIRALLQPGEDRRPAAEDRSIAVAEKPVARRRGRKVRTNSPEPDRAQLVEGDSTQLTGEDSVHLSMGDSAEFTEADRTELPGGGRKQLAGAGRTRLAGRDRKGLAGPDSAKLAGGDSTPLAQAGKPTHAGGTSVRYSRGVARGLHEVESKKEEAIKKKDDSNHLSPKNGFGKNEKGVTPPPYSPYIASVITDFSTELNDPSHIISNVTQVLRIWESSGLDEQQFTELLYEAKRITRSYQGKQGLGGMNNKMAYFFKVARDLCDSQLG